MDDRHQQFLITLADAYASARIAELTIEIQTADGTRLAGVPALGDDEVWPADDDIDDAELSIDGQAVALKSVVAFVVHAPTRNRDSLAP